MIVVPWRLLLGSGGQRPGVLLTSQNAQDSPSTESHLALENPKVENPGVGQEAPM